MLATFSDVYIYVYKERERERERDCLFGVVVVYTSAYLGERFYLIILKKKHF